MAELSSRSDEELLSEQGAHGEALSEIIRRYRATVSALARRYSPMADYEELLSDGFCALISAADSFDETRGSFSAYAGTCVRNAMKNVILRSAKHSNMLSGSDSPDDEIDRSGAAYPSPEEIYLEKLAGEELHRAFSSVLTPLEMRCIDGVILGLSYDEIAQQLGIDKKSADNAISRARAKLRRHFDQDDNS